MEKVNVFIKVKNFYKSHFYFCSVGIFVLWVALFDPNSLLSQQQTRSRISNLEKEKKFYIKETQRIRSQFEKIKDNENEMCKLAREKYFFRKEGEEIFLLKKKK